MKSNSIFDNENRIRETVSPVLCLTRCIGQKKTLKTQFSVEYHNTRTTGASIEIPAKGQY